MQLDILPVLPTKLNKREAKITPRILKWFRENYDGSCAIEIKATNTNTVPPSAVKLHQLQALKAVRSPQGFTHKLSDIGRITQPFDAFQYKNTQSFVVVCFLKDNKCLAIDPNVWNGARVTTPCDFSFKI